MLGGSRREGDLYFSPTIVANVQSEDPLLKDEIFGPILPIHVVADINEGIAYVNSHDQPLALYCFTSQANFKEIIRRTRSGGVAFGDLMLQYLPHYSARTSSPDPVDLSETTAVSPVLINPRII